MFNPEREQNLLGRPVRSLQQMLRTIHFADASVPQLIPNGVFDAETERAVIAFQRTQGLPATGRADYATWTALVRAYRAAERVLAHAIPLRVVFQRGCSIGPDERHMHLYPYQAALAALSAVLDVPPLRVTGTNDRASQTATRWLQQRAGLPATGQVDKATWDALSCLYPAVLGDGSLDGDRQPDTRSK